MDEIPTSVETAVRDVAQTAPGLAGDIDQVYRRARRRRARQVAAAFAAVAVVVTAVGAGVVLGRPVPEAAPGIDIAPAQSVAAVPAQRLVLGNYSPVKPGITEIRPDSWRKPLFHRVAGADSWDKAVGLPDGRIVALGPLDTEPGVQRQDGPEVTGLQMNLVVAGSDDQVELKRNVRRQGEPVSMLTATAKAAYLWRPAGLFAHDLATGAEKLVLPLAPGPFATDGGPGFDAADMSGDRVVLARQPKSCSLQLFDSGKPLAGPSLRNCQYVSRLRLSPDGATVAVVYARPDAQMRVAKIRIADSAVVAEVDGSGAGNAKQSPAEVALAWPDNQMVRGLVIEQRAGGRYAFTAEFTM